jgi:hypothetical protein
LVVFDDADLEALLAYGAERSFVELKSPGLLTDRPLVAQIVRAMMAMANSQGGGLVVIGVRQVGAIFTPVGLSVKELASWANKDDFADRVAAWSDPPARYNLHRPQIDGKTYVVVNVEEFDREPVICKKSYGDVLAEGACYVRPRRKPESVPVRTTADMRDLIRLAADKELRDFLARAGRAGLGVGPSDGDRFDEQVSEQGPAEDISEKIQDRGHWRISVRPLAFEVERVPFGDVEDLVRRSAVKVRGWDFPHVDRRKAIERGVDWVGQGSDWSDNVEVWRIWTSGQLISLRGFREDWLDQSQWSAPPAGWQPGASLGILESLICIWEGYELAARLALSSAGGDQMRVSVTAVGLAGRTLVMDDQRRVPLFQDYSATIAEFPDVSDVLAADLVADPMTLAVRVAHRLFQRFGWTPDETVLLDALTRFRDSR